MNERAETREELVAFLEQEKAAAKKEAKMFWGVGSLLVFVIIAYFSWLYTTVKQEILNPQALADVAMVAVQDNADKLPAYMKQTEKELVDYAPEFSRTVSNEIINAFPILRKELESEIQEILYLIPTINEEAGGAMKAYFTINKDDIAEFYAAHSDAEFAEYLIDGMLEHVAEILSDDMFVFAGRKDTEDFKARSLELIKGLNKSMKELTKKNPNRLTRKERQQVRLISSIYNALN